MKQLNRVVACVFPMFVMPVIAAPAPQTDEWRHAVTPYLWASGMGGTAVAGTPLGPLQTAIDSSFGDIIESLKMGGMLSYEGRRGQWLLLGDFIYMDIGAAQTREAPPATARASMDSKQLALEADAGYFVTDEIAIYVGARFNDLDTTLRLEVSSPQGSTARRAGTGASWVDPLVGLFGRFVLADRWGVDLKADIGGFGAGSELTWQIATGVRWQFRDNMDFSAGYRYVSTDYEKGGATGLLKYDVVSHGPQFGVTWKF